MRCGLHEVSVQLLPIAGHGLEVGLLKELVDRVLDLRIIHVAEVLVVRRLDGVPVNQEEEVERMGEILEPVGEPGLGFRLLVPDRLEVDAAVKDLRRRVEPDVVELSAYASVTLSVGSSLFP